MWVDYHTHTHTHTHSIPTHICKFLGSLGCHSPGLYTARTGLHTNGTACALQPGEAARPGAGRVRRPGDHTGRRCPPARPNGRRLSFGYCDGLLPAGVPERHSSGGKELKRRRTRRRSSNRSQAKSH